MDDDKTFKKKVLLIEDEEALRDAIKFRLEKEGVGLIQAATGEEGLESLQKELPDLVMLDILLPGMNGLEVLRRIRECPQTRGLPVIIVSVSSSREKIKQALSLNVVDYLVKSDYSLNGIVEKVVNFLNNVAGKGKKQ